MKAAAATSQQTTSSTTTTLTPLTPPLSAAASSATQRVSPQQQQHLVPATTTSAAASGTASSSDAPLEPLLSESQTIYKVKRFLCTLIQFGADISADTGERVKELVFNLVVSSFRPYSYIVRGVFVRFRASCASPCANDRRMAS